MRVQVQVRMRIQVQACVGDTNEVEQKWTHNVELLTKENSEYTEVARC